MNTKRSNNSKPEKQSLLFYVGLLHKQIPSACWQQANIKKHHFENYLTLVKDGERITNAYHNGNPKQIVFAVHDKIILN